LLDAYWKHRIHRDDGRRAREAVLSAVVEKIVIGGPGSDFIQERLVTAPQ
jgi:hypothetical protein